MSKRPPALCTAAGRSVAGGDGYKGSLVVHSGPPILLSPTSKLRSAHHPLIHQPRPLLHLQPQPQPRIHSHLLITMTSMDTIALSLFQNIKEGIETGRIANVDTVQTEVEAAIAELDHTQLLEGPTNDLVG